MTGMGRRRETGPPGRGAARPSANGIAGAELLRDADRRTAWMLLIDGVPQSHVDLDDPAFR